MVFMLFHRSKRLFLLAWTSARTRGGTLRDLDLKRMRSMGGSGAGGSASTEGGSGGSTESGEVAAQASAPSAGLGRGVRGASEVETAKRLRVLALQPLKGLAAGGRRLERGPSLIVQAVLAISGI